MNFNSGGRVVAGSNPVIPTKLSAKPSIERSRAFVFSTRPCLHGGGVGKTKAFAPRKELCARLCNLPKGATWIGVAEQALPAQQITVMMPKRAAGLTNKRLNIC